VDMCFVRLPIDREGRHAIPLYQERPVVVVPKEHPIEAFEQVSVADLVDERMQDADDLDGLAETLELVAAVGGAAIMPHSLARLHHRRDLVYREVTDLPATEIALAWPVDSEHAAIEDFIGVVRGRTAASTRGRHSEGDATQDDSTGRKTKAAGNGAGSGRGGNAESSGSKGGSGKNPGSKTGTVKAGGSAARKSSGRAKGQRRGSR
ncbi:LysR substrate-binding domain-containing protein, partial [Nocardia alni]|uniref:LysR substrate-binding domain-containing protein n=1 Tax=Nocardia alni TaxID=2815723 RepID=UPI0020B458FF